MDINTHGSGFTWRNIQQGVGRIYKCLDLFLYNTSWNMLAPNILRKQWRAKELDHKVLLLEEHVNR